MQYTRFAITKELVSSYANHGHPGARAAAKFLALIVRRHELNNYNRQLDLANIDDANGCLPASWPDKFLYSEA